MWSSAPRHSLWYMEKDKNWFRNFWYMRPSGLRQKAEERAGRNSGTPWVYPAPPRTPTPTPREPVWPLTTSA